jgi:hypothetical protein
MSSELLGSAQNVLKGNLGGAWDITNGYQDAYTDLGIARRFGGAAAAYSLRDIGAMNGRVVKARRSEDDLEEDFSANQVQDGTLENWVNGKLESTLPADVATAAAAYSLRKVKASYSGDAVRIRRGDTDGEADVAFDSDGKVSNDSLVTVITGSGDTGSTLYTYLRANDPDGADAYVDTWYDQSGVNNAVQETAANQPKIAESGALLADGLKFDGSNDVLVSTSFSATQPITTSAVFKSSNTSDSQTVVGGRTYNYIIHRAGGAATAGLNTGTLYAPFSSITTKQLMTTLANGASSTVSQNGVISSTGNAGTGDQTDLGIGSNGNGGTAGSGSAKFDGSIEEVIVYDSDQSNNRFKIESNINNYYGLYNDANEVTGAFTSSGAESFTANGTDGFTLTNSTSTAFGGIELNQVLAAGEKIYVSFNLSIDAGANTSPNLNIREGSITGTTASDEGFFDPSQGFNSTVFTSDSGGDARYISFGENDADPSTYTISDFKVSRIARNGFVETWYDQSGNGNDATQGTASQQPSIVLNGGLSSDGIEFDGSNDEMDLTSALGATTVQSIFAVQKNDITSGGSLLFDNRDANDDGSALFATDSAGNKQASWDAVDAEHTATTNEELIGLIKTSSAITIRANGVQKSSTSSSSTIDISTVPRIGQGSFGVAGTNYDGSIKEIICFNTDTSSDVSEIEKDIANYYNITLS